jgi:hypothetical protein
MRIKNGLAVLAGAVALACAGAASAQTSAGPNGTIFINIVDTTSGTSFLFDTGLLVSSFADPTSYSVNLATNSASSAAYAAFVASEGGSDTIDYSVVGNYAPTSGTPLDLTLVTAASTPTPPNGAHGVQAAGQIQAFLGTNSNPAGGATFFASSVTTQWNSTFEPGLATALGNVSDNALVGSTIGFYAITTTGNSNKGGVSVSPFASSWDLSSAGVLTYSSGSPVPLPTPLLLMLSGLGLLGLVGRRKQVATDFNGAAV